MKDNKEFDTDTTPSVVAPNHEALQEMTNPQGQKFTFLLHNNVMAADSNVRPLFSTAV